MDDSRACRCSSLAKVHIVCSDCAAATAPDLIGDLLVSLDETR